MYENPLSCTAKPSFVEILHCTVNAFSAPLWDVLIWMLVGIGFFFTVFSGFA